MTKKDDLFDEQEAQADAEAQPEPYTGETPGQILREAREAKGLSTQQLADSLRLRKTVVEMIEGDEYEKMASPTFVRGYLRSFSKALEVDEKRVFEAYGKMGFGEVAASTITMQSFSRRKVRERNDNRLMLISYLIIAIVIAMAVVWWLQESGISLNSSNSSDNNQNNSQRSTAAAGSNNDNTLRTAIVPSRRASQPTPVTTEETRTSDDAAATAADILSESESESESQPEPKPEATEPKPEATEPKPEPEATQVATVAATQAELIMNFSADCWVKVTDATGNDIAIGVKNAGYTMPLRGESPFDIILCKPEAVSMTYNGESVDLSGYRRNRSVTMTLE